MRKISVEYKLYEYHELSNAAKEKVMQWYLDDPVRSEMFEENINQDLKYLFPNSKLKIQESLSCSQGDGLNIYGNLDLNDVLHAINDNEYCGDTFKDFRQILTEHEQKTIKAYMKVCGTDIHLPQNIRGDYCVADRTAFDYEWIEELESYGYSNINTSAIYNLQNLVIDMFKHLAWIYQRQGYNYLYNVEDEEIEDACEANEWEFLEDGTFWNA